MTDVGALIAHGVPWDAAMRFTPGEAQVIREAIRRERLAVDLDLDPTGGD